MNIEDLTIKQAREHRPPSSRKPLIGHEVLRRAVRKLRHPAPIECI